MTTAHSRTDTVADAPSTQGFRAVMRCRWQVDETTGRLTASWHEELELWPADGDPAPR